jgi:hypothetical protein
MLSVTTPAEQLDAEDSQRRAGGHGEQRHAGDVLPAWQAGKLRPEKLKLVVDRVGPDRLAASSSQGRLGVVGHAGMFWRKPD